MYEKLIWNIKYMYCTGSLENSFKNKDNKNYYKIVAGWLLFSLFKSVNTDEC